MAKLAGGVHRLDGQLMVVLDVDRVLEIVPETMSKTTSKTALAA
jgi:purine-binding chemotaxis protein CheW